MDGAPSCGLYRTVADIGEIPAGRLVYFHNHGDPGPGVFPPSGWRGNRAEFKSTGQMLPDADAKRYLEPLPEEGFYRVVEEFYCCDKRCRQFQTHMLVQLGYDDVAKPILFVPEWIDGVLTFPADGTAIDREKIARMSALKVAMPSAGD